MFIFHGLVQNNLNAVAVDEFGQSILWPKLEWSKQSQVSYTCTFVILLINAVYN